MYDCDFMEAARMEPMRHNLELKNEEREKIKRDTELFLKAGKKIKYVGNKTRDKALPPSKWILNDRGEIGASANSEYRNKMLNEYKAHQKENRRQMARSIYRDLKKDPLNKNIKKIDLARVVRGKMIEAFKEGGIIDPVPVHRTIFEYLDSL